MPSRPFSGPGAGVPTPLPAPPAGAALLPDDRRRAERHHPARVIRCRVLPAGPASEHGAALVNVSALGAGLLLRWWFAPRPAVTLRFRRRAYRAPFPAVARLAHCADAR